MADYCIIPTLFAYFWHAIPTSSYIFNVFIFLFLYFFDVINLSLKINVNLRPKKSILSSVQVVCYHP